MYHDLKWFLILKIHKKIISRKTIKNICHKCRVWITTVRQIINTYLNLCYEYNEYLYNVTHWIELMCTYLREWQNYWTLCNSIDQCLFCYGANMAEIVSKDVTSSPEHKKYTHYYFKVFFYRKKSRESCPWVQITTSNPWGIFFLLRLKFAEVDSVFVQCWPCYFKQHAWYWIYKKKNLRNLPCVEFILIVFFYSFFLRQFSGQTSRVAMARY